MAGGERDAGAAPDAPGGDGTSGGPDAAGGDGAIPTAGGVGPAASSPFVTVDFANPTSPAGVAGVVVSPQLFGVSTGGLAGNTFSALSNATTRALVKALDVPLLRLNANFESPQTAAGIAPLVSSALELFPSSSTWVIGVDTASAATSLASYVKASSPIPAIHGSRSARDARRSPMSRGCDRPAPAVSA